MLTRGNNAGVPKLLITREMWYSLVSIPRETSRWYGFDPREMYRWYGLTSSRDVMLVWFSPSRDVKMVWFSTSRDVC